MRENGYYWVRPVKFNKQGPWTIGNYGPFEYGDFYLMDPIGCDRLWNEVELEVGERIAPPGAAQFLITNCRDCPYIDFTPGGARKCCDHQDAVERATESKGIKGDRFHWKHRTLTKSREKDMEDIIAPPRWCPLRKP